MLGLQKCLHQLKSQLPFLFQVLFLPLSNTIVTCFKDDSLFGWDSETLKCKFQLPVPPEEGKQPHYRALATPRDGRLLVAGGRLVTVYNSYQVQLVN